MMNWDWTNRSVALMAGGEDPVDAVREKARETVLNAIDAGWDGPPFDPFRLADILGIETAAKSGIRDARTVPVGQGRRFRIEYNPVRSPARVRYSVAHEIAHTLFPDAAEEIRNRARRSDVTGDDWQLESLCNVAAAELLMPLGSFPKLREEQVTIEEFVNLRKAYAVSMEALLIRAVRLSEAPIAVFAASRVEEGARAGHYRVEYAIPSTTWGERLTKGTILGHQCVAAQCTGIGFTAMDEESWPAWSRAHRVECVGLPPYPGSRFPRVAGIVRDVGVRPTRSAIEFVRGDATAPRARPAVVAQVVNDQTANWGGGGFAVAVRRKWGHVQDDFRVWAAENSLRLGATQVAEAEKGLWVASMVAQSGYGPSVRPRIRYAALREALSEVGKMVLERKASMHVPRIGAGQAGGDWTIVEELIREECVARGVVVTVYDLPDAPVPKAAQPSLRFPSA